MNDDALLPDHELASAYIDGELSEAERAQVESTPHLAALVAAFTKVRAKIADVSAPDPQARESAVAASLSQYDTLFGGASSPSAEESSANVLPLTGRLAGRQVWRGRWARPLLVAAASVILLGVAGVTVLNNNEDNADDQSASLQTASKELAASDEAESAPADVSLSTIGAINGPASAVTQILDGAQLLEFADQYAPVAADDGGAGTDTSPAAAESTAAEPTEMRVSACPLSENQVIIADIIWIDTLAVAVRNMDTGEVQAIDAQCRVLVSVTP
jgi:anti-sigma factor RsiW